MHPLTPISIPPGVVSDFADHDATGRWVASNLVRFRDGRLENMGPWRRLFSKPVLGVPRAAISWPLLDGSRVAALASAEKVFLYRDGGRFDITPVRASGTLGGDPFATTNGSAVVVVTHTSHAVSVGDYVRFSGASAVGGLDLNGEFIAASVLTGNTYTITAASSATATVTGGGSAVAYSYDIHRATDSALNTDGWGAGGWGDGPWGGPALTATIVEPRVWWLDTWGEDLLLTHTNGSIYWWDASSGVQTRAAVVSGAPTGNTGLVVSPEDRHLIVFGAGGDPLQVQWPNQGSLTNWTKSDASTSDTRRVQHGARLVAGLKIASEVLLWTDTSLYSLRYTGGVPISHSLRRVAGGISIMAPKAAAEFADRAYWMGKGSFYIYNGGSIQQLPCPLFLSLLEQLDHSQAHKIVAGSNPLYSEVIWFWPSALSGECDKYIKYSVTSDAWDIGELARSAWWHDSENGNPIAAAPDGLVYEHEFGDVAQAMQVTLRCRKYASSQALDFGPYAISPSSTNLRIRARGRHIALRISGEFEADGVVQEWWAESSSFVVAEGQKVMQISRIIPDVKFLPHRVRLGAMRFALVEDGDQ